MWDQQSKQGHTHGKAYVLASELGKRALFIHTKSNERNRTLVIVTTEKTDAKTGELDTLVGQTAFMLLTFSCHGLPGKLFLERRNLSFQAISTHTKNTLII